MPIIITNKWKIKLFQMYIPRSHHFFGIWQRLAEVEGGLKYRFSYISHRKVSNIKISYWQIVCVAGNFSLCHKKITGIQIYMWCSRDYFNTLCKQPEQSYGTIFFPGTIEFWKNITFFKRMKNGILQCENPIQFLILAIESSILFCLFIQL